ncbi:DNA-binding domain-containing protein [Pelagibacterium montanilacus]|uniref:HvfC/BufC N-terminal domain-containing protein n=1 Tax=Pelagibacterium montanilacus TaxID=2185280 RepID=UPI000F8EC50E|nr:DNA-binding domain-containing protein [Pelagibacterium montanilacus]
MSARPTLQSWSRAFAAALTDPAAPVPAGLETGNTPADRLRFAVYRNNVHVGLVEALRRAFPVVERVVGDAFFTAMARDYVTHNKPTSPVLILYGDRFAAFIAAFAPAARLPYLPDLARLERAWLESYHAADVAALGVPALAALDAALLAGAVLTPHPAARVVRSSYAVGSIWSAHSAARTHPSGRIDAGRAETVLVTRPEARVDVTIIPDRDAGFVLDVLAGTPLGEAAVRASQANPAFDFGTALTGLVRKGALAATTTQGAVT